MSRYGALGASSRLRTMQYLPALRAAGYEVDMAPLLNDAYVRGMYAGSVSSIGVARSYIQRLRWLFSIRRYGVVWLETELLPWLPAWLELALVPRSIRLIVDYGDAVFHRYDMHRSALVRKLLGHKIDAVMRRANLVTAGNAYLAERARKAGCVHVEWLPTVIDLQRYPVREPDTSRDEVVVGWIGSPSTAGYLKIIAPVLTQMCKIYRVRCVAIGARPDQVAGTPFEAMPWAEESEVALLRQFDIGIMPLRDEPWEHGKCGYKLIQYMACSLPVIASPIGVNAELVRDGENGYLANGASQWAAALERLILDRQLRMTLGVAGRRQVEEIWCLQVQAPRLVGMLSGVTRAGRP